MKKIIFIAMLLCANAACVAKRGAHVASTEATAFSPDKLVFASPKDANGAEQVLTIEKAGSKYNGSLVSTKTLVGDTVEKLFSGINCSFQRDDDAVLQTVSCVIYDRRPLDGPYTADELHRQDDGSYAAYAVTGGGNIMELSDNRLIADKLQLKP